MTSLKTVCEYFSSLVLFLPFSGNPNNDQLSGGIIAAIVFGVIALIVVVVIIVIVIIKCKKEPPDAPSKFAVIQVSTYSVILTWEKGYNENHQRAFVIQYTDTITGETQKQKIDNKTKSLNYTKEITGLRPGTIYHFWIYSTNILTRSFMSKNPVIAETLKESSDDQFKFTVEEVKNNSVTITWVFELNDSHHQAFVIQYTDKEDGWRKKLKVDNTSQTSHYREEIKGLKPGTIYFFWIFREDNSIVSKTPISATTLKAPPDAPSNFTFIDTKTNSVSLTWQRGLHECHQQTFVIRYKDTVNGKTQENIIQNTSNYTADITELKPETIYHFWIYSTNINGSSSLSIKPIITETLPAPPDAPSKFTVIQVSFNSVILTWEKGCNDNQPRAFVIQYTDTFTGETQEQKIDNKTKSLNYTKEITGLRSGTIYHFWIYSTNILSRSFISKKPVIAETLKELSDDHCKFTVEKIKNNSVTITLKKELYDSHPHAFVIQYTDKEDGERKKQKIDNISQTSPYKKEIEELKPGTIYYFWIYREDNSILSKNPISATTLKAPADAPSNFTLVDTKTNSVSLTWQRGLHEDHQQTFVILYKDTVNGKTQEKIIEDTNHTSNCTTEVTGLNPKTIYLFWIYSSNKNSNSSLSVKPIITETLKENKISGEGYSLNCFKIPVRASSVEPLGDITGNKKENDNHDREQNMNSAMSQRSKDDVVINISETSELSPRKLLPILDKQSENQTDDNTVKSKKKKKKKRKQKGRSLDDTTFGDDQP